MVHLFAHLWQLRIVRNVWTRPPPMSSPPPPSIPQGGGGHSLVHEKKRVNVNSDGEEGLSHH